MAKILAIDDKRDNLETIKALLKHLMPELEVLTAPSGQEGIELARQNDIDTIVLDIIMPDMDGYEVCRILKSDELTKNIPILMLTAIKTDTQSRIKGLQQGAEAFFSKPIDPYELTAQVKVMLRIKESEDKLRQEKESLMASVDNKTRALLENEIKLTRIVEGFAIPSFVIDTDHKITHWNRALEILSGLREKDMIGTENHWKYLHNSQRPLLADLVLDNASEDEINALYGEKWNKSSRLHHALEAEKVFLNQYEQEVWLFTTAVPIRNESGEIICALQTIQDISDRKKNEIELVKHKENLEEIVKERTKKLEQQNDEMQQMNKLFVGREFRIKELRDKVKVMGKKLKDNNIDY